MEALRSQPVDRLSLGPPAPVSQSPLWRIQEDYYRAQGPAAWDGQVPFLLTNSAATAQVYAELILAFVRDLGPDPHGRPITILELGTGLGRLGFLLCRELERQRSYFAATRQQPFRLILSDVAAENVDFWDSHSSLQRYAEAGWLDFASFNPLQDSTLTLRRSGEVLGPGSLETPLVVLANYFFDSLPHDEFQIRNRQLHECAVEVLRIPRPRYSQGDYTDIRDVTCQRSYRPVNTDYYAVPAWNGMLADYLASVPAGAITMPVGGLQTLERLQKLSSAGMMLLASDRAYTTPQTMANYIRHDHDTHRGGFSFFVNFDALGRHFQSQAGRYLYTPYASTEGVQTMVGVTLGADREWENLEFCFREHLVRTSRINGAGQSLSLLRPERTSLEDARALLALLRQNLCDSHAVAACARRLLETVDCLRQEDRRELVSLLDEAWSSFYLFPGAARLPQVLAQLYRALQQHERAVECYDRALELAADDAHLHMFRAASLIRLGRHDEARDGHARAVALDPSMADLDPASAP